MEYAKAKTAAKDIRHKGRELESTVRSTMQIISEIVGATLGPGGRPVVIERQETNMPPVVTKDGVTVYRSLGFPNSVQQLILEVARDASIKTAGEAGDGTTSCCVLSEAAIKYIDAFCHSHSKQSPQKVTRHLQTLYKTVVEPTIRQCSIAATLAEDRALLYSVAKLSANGDGELADAVLECFDIVGDEGNVTIAEMTGKTAYEVQAIDGFPIAMGLEESCRSYNPMFINDPGNQRCLLRQPSFLFYFGEITQIQQVIRILEAAGNAFEGGQFVSGNLVIVANGFSESVIGQLGVNMQSPNSINVFPLTAPRTAIPNSQLNFMQDLAALVGGKVLDPATAPLERATLADLSPEALNETDGVQSFEVYRYRSMVIGHGDEDLILERVAHLQTQLKNAESRLDAAWLEERIGKITGGIARLNVVGASVGEIRERRDRAEDAVCAVRGALKHGILPGGGWMLLKLATVLQGKAFAQDEIAAQVLVPTLIAPVSRMLQNCGLSTDEITEILIPIWGRLEKSKNSTTAYVYDALEQKHVLALEGGILDSAPAVLEAIKNSLSIAGLLGTLGGVVAFRRDYEVDKAEARDVSAFLRDGDTFDRNA